MAIFSLKRFHEGSCLGFVKREPIMILDNYEAVIFDMDGVLVDNHHAHFQAWMALSKKYQFPLSDEIYLRDYNGKTNKDLFNMIFGEISQDRFEELVQEKEKMYQEAAQNLSELNGLTDFLKKLKSKGLKLAVGTSAPSMNVKFILDRLNLRSYFDVVVDGFMVTKGKPDPEIYNKCKSLLGVSKAIVFEDALLGIEAGKRAHCDVIGVATTHKREELESKVEHIVSDFIEAQKILF